MNLFLFIDEDSWREAIILVILANEKYKGDALLQKIYTVDFLLRKGFVIIC